MIKKIILIIVMCLVCFSFVHAEEITLQNGQVLNIDNLTEDEVLQAITTAKKSMKGQESTESVMSIVKGIDPVELQAWGKLISGTIKTICDDLSITVNEFVKTPVGMGIAALIAYRVAGKDLLENALDIIIMVPLWFLLTGVILYLGWCFFSTKTIYEKIDYTEKGKKIKESPKRISRYPWEPVMNTKDTNPKFVLAIMLFLFEIGGTVLTLMIILS